LVGAVLQSASLVPRSIAVSGHRPPRARQSRWLAPCHSQELHSSSVLLRSCCVTTQCPADGCGLCFHRDLARRCVQASDWPRGMVLQAMSALLCFTAAPHRTHCPFALVSLGSVLVCSRPLIYSFAGSVPAFCCRWYLLKEAPQTGTAPTSPRLSRELTTARG